MADSGLEHSDALKRIIAEAMEAQRRIMDERGERRIRESVDDVMGKVDAKIATSKRDVLRDAHDDAEAVVWDWMPKKARVPVDEGHYHEPNGGGADCMFDYLISECWTGPEGQVHTSLTGCEFRIYSTIGGAFDHAEALATLEDRAFYICGGTYIEQVTAVPPNAAHWDIFGAGSGNTIWQASANSQTLWTVGTVSSGSRIRLSRIEFDLSTYTSATGISTTNGNFYIEDCHFVTGGATSSIALKLHNTVEGFVSRCSFTGSGVGYNPTTAQMTIFDDCYFNCAEGLDITGNRVKVTNSTFDCSAMDVRVRTGGEITLALNTFNKGTSITGAPLDNLVISTNTFRLAGSEVGIACSPTVNSEGWAITNNSFSGAASTVGISLDAQMTSGVIALNTFQNFTSGNEITGTGGAALQGFHNSSSDGSSGTDQPLADFGPVVGHNTAASVAPSDAQYLTLAANATLTNERVFTPRYNIYGTDGGAGAAYSLDSWLEGVAIASAAALTLGTDGDFFHVTGTTTITSINVPTRQTLVLLVFDGILTFTHSANLILQGAANMTTAAGDCVMLAYEGSSVWREINRHTAAAAGGGVTDATYVTLSTNATLTDERVLTAGGGITLTDAGAGSTITVDAEQVMQLALMAMGMS